MTSSLFRRQRLNLLTTAAAIAVTLPTSALAQAQPPEQAPPAEQTPPAEPAPPAETAPPPAGPAAPAEATEPQRQAEAVVTGEEEIVVTGSLIRNPNLEASAPVSVIGAEEIDLQQANVAEELLRELPGAVADIGSAVNNGSLGQSFVNLRNLGSNRNIVLLDGTRLVPADLLGRFDLNNIPLALIQRVDVLTGGASTTYGADAVGGVVNFITRKDFAGAELNASEQITEEGDGNSLRVDATIGANFDDDRGNATLSIGYQETDPVYQGQRNFSLTSIESLLAEFPGGSVTTVPSAFSFSGGAGPAGTPGRLTGDRQVDPALGFAVRPQDETDVFAPFNFNPFNVFQTPFERFNIFGQANYEIADGIEIYARGLFSKNTVETIVAPSGVFTSNVTIPVSNPFLPAALRAQFCANNDFQHGAANGSGANAGAVGSLDTPGIQTLTPAECAAAALATDPTDPNYRTFTTNLSRRTTEVGPRIDEFVTTYFDYQLGVRGDLMENLRYDVFGSYGESENRQSRQNYVALSRARQALLATDPTTCLDPNNGCVPVNVFGEEGTISADAAEFLRVESTILRPRMKLAQVRGTIDGDLGVSVPWAETAPSFAIGGEYRDYNAEIRPDILAAQAGELGGAGGAVPLTRGSFNVKEAFGELIVPIVEDKPFFQSLSIEAGVRYSDYEVQAPGNPTFDTWTYKVGGQWEPGYGLKIRGNYARAVRAPNISELFAPVATGLTNLGTDPCAGAAPVSSADLRAICIAQGAPAFAIGSITQPIAGQANATTGGNLNLGPEKADTYTVGIVFQPEFVSGLSLTVDYFNIKIKKAITIPTPGDVIALCFDNVTAASATDPNCTSIGRDPNTGNLNGDPATTTGLPLALTNLGTLEGEGVDLTVNYTRDLGFANLALGFVGTYNKDGKFKATPASINRECVGFYSVNCLSIQPKFQFSQRTTLSFGDTVDVSLLWRFIDAVKFEPAQLASDLEAADAQNRDADGNLLPVDEQGCPDFAGADPNGCIFDPQFRSIDTHHYFDLTTRVGVTENVTLTFTVQNLLDKKPPIVGGTIGSTSFNSGNTYPSTYDALGRRYGAALRVRF